MRYAQSIGANVAAIEVLDYMTVSPVHVAVYAGISCRDFLNNILKKESMHFIAWVAFICFTVYFFMIHIVIKDFNHYKAISIFEMIQSLYV